jgi:dihydroorotate dehydrogenase
MYKLIRPLLFQMDAERAHEASLKAAEWVQAINPSLVDPLYAYEDERLKQRVWGMAFPNPVGLAAGADKNARLLRFWGAVGFGFVEVGSVTARPSSGNPRPRAFRLPADEALVNRLGLNNDGAEAVAERLERESAAFERPLGVNIAKTHDPDIMGADAREDFRESFHRLAPQADYIALNVSCPNTRDGKTFEDPDALDALLGTIVEERRAPGIKVPILVKLSPPVSSRVAFDSRLEDLIAVARAHGVDGFIATNTASDREGLESSSRRLEDIGEGGLSGRPLAERSTRLVRYLYRATDGEVPIVGVGGVRDADSAYAKIRAGASLVQLYTALVYEGPGLVKRIKEGLVERIREDDFTSVADAVGADA